MRFWHKTSQQPWAITESALTSILDVAARNNQDPDTVAAQLGRALDNTYEVTSNEGITIIPVSGPLFRYANLFTKISGASSYERITQDFIAALNDESVGAIVLDFDSPGGEVNGCSQLANCIFKARGKKPIIAYASGDCASGAYWIASACDQIFVDDTASLGSIGVVAVARKKSNDETHVEFVSSQSPHKRLDVEQDEGRARVQARVDALAAVFIENVAAHRGVSVEHVLEHFGQGDIHIGQHAVDAGLANGLATLNDVVESVSMISSSASVESASIENEEFDPHVSDSVKPATAYLNDDVDRHDELDADVSSTHNTLQDTLMDLDELIAQHPDLYAQVCAQAHQKVSARITAILSDDACEQRMPVAMQLALNTDLSVEAALAVLVAVPKTAVKKPEINQAEQAVSHPAENVEHPTTDFMQMMSRIDNPEISPQTSQDSDVESEDATAKRIAQLSV